MIDENVRKQIEQLRSSLNEGYHRCKTYESKLEYLYKIIMISQGEYLKYTNNNLFTTDYLETLKTKLKTLEHITDSEFIDFLQEEIIQKLDSPHVTFKGTNGEGEIIEEKLPEDLKELYIERKRLLQVRGNITYRFDDETLTVTIPSFSRKYLNADIKVLEEIKEALNNTDDIKNVIIDIRGNGGGTDEYFRHLSMFTPKDINTVYAFRNLFTGENEYHKWDSVIPKNNTGKSYNMFLLVDNEVFSTAESFASIIKESGLATLVGEQTRGEGRGFTPLSIKLTDDRYVGKNSKEYLYVKGMELHFPTEAPINERGEIDYENYYNTTPDIVCDSKIALQVAYELIELNKKKSL